jgi:hypothetical protein
MNKMNNGKIKSREAKHKKPHPGLTRKLSMVVIMPPA